METTPTYKRLIKKAKELQITTKDELYDLMCTDEFADATPFLTGADFEIAKKHLKLD